MFQSYEGILFFTLYCLPLNYSLSVLSNFEYYKLLHDLLGKILYDGCEKLFNDTSIFLKHRQNIKYKM